MTLTPEQEEWLQALESGKYTQGKLKLRAKPTPETAEWSYCCLGIACELFKDRLTITSSEEISGFQLVTKYADSTVAALPNNLVAFLHLNSPLGNFRGPNYTDKSINCGSLSSLNDSSGKNFQEIAAFIRANPQLVFTNV